MLAVSAPVGTAAPGVLNDLEWRSGNQNCKRCLPPAGAKESTLIASFTACWRSWLIPSAGAEPSGSVHRALED